MILVISEQTQNILVIVGAFIGGVLITMIANMFSNSQLKRLEKRRDIRNEMLLLLNDIQENSSKNNRQRVEVTPDNINYDRNRIFKASKILEYHYLKYKIYFNKSKIYKQQRTELNNILKEIDSKDTEKLSPGSLKKMSDGIVGDYIVKYIDSCTTLINDLSEELFDRSRNKCSLISRVFNFLLKKLKFFFKSRKEKEKKKSDKLNTNFTKILLYFLYGVILAFVVLISVGILIAPFVALKYYPLWYTKLFIILFCLYLLYLNIRNGIPSLRFLIKIKNQKNDIRTYKFVEGIFTLLMLVLALVIFFKTYISL